MSHEPRATDVLMDVLMSYTSAAYHVVDVVDAIESAGLSVVHSADLRKLEDVYAYHQIREGNFTATCTKCGETMNGTLVCGKCEK